MDTHIVLPITLTAAGAATLLNIWIARRVGQVRMSQKISIGDGGDERLVARMRAHSNFVEYTPFFLILLGLVELAIGGKFWLWLAAAVFILARIAHALGMTRPRPDPLRLRLIGTIVTLLVLFGLALVAIALPYWHWTRPPTVTYAAG
jgi:uncharacterized membrane protein YecN with MAPEG domain